MRAAVSIVIPVYNAQEYLQQCLGNVVNQTLQDIEIILVNDASTDQSLSIMKDCQRQYPDKVKIIDSKVNSGAGGARNLAIEAAEGEYIGFVDSDDMIEATMYEKLYAKAKEADYEVVDSGYYKQAEDLAMLHVSDELCGVLDSTKRKELIVGGGYIVSKIFKRELFADQNLRFRENVILEDADFLVYLYSTIYNIGNVKEILYYYRNNRKSSSNVKSTTDYYDNIYHAMTAIYEKTLKLPDYKEVQEAIEYELIQLYSYGVNICLKDYLGHGEMQCEQKLCKLAQLRKKVIKGDYENTYVVAKVGQLDIAIMQLNDRSPKDLLVWAKQQAGGKSER